MEIVTVFFSLSTMLKEAKPDRHFVSSHSHFKMPEYSYSLSAGAKFGFGLNSSLRQISNRRKSAELLTYQQGEPDCTLWESGSCGTVISGRHRFLSKATLLALMAEQTLSGTSINVSSCVDLLMICSVWGIHLFFLKVYYRKSRQLKCQNGTRARENKITLTN